MTPSQRTIGGAYSCFIVFAFVFVMIGIIFTCLMCLLILNPLAKAWFSGGYWWLFILSPLAFLLLVIMTACMLRRKEDKATLERHMSIFKALKKAEDAYLGDTGITLSPGEYSSWIEVAYNAYKPDRGDNELGDFERVRRDGSSSGRSSGRSRGRMAKSRMMDDEEVRVGRSSPGRSRSPPRSPGRSTRNAPDDDFEVSRSQMRRSRPENEYIRSIKQERAEVMLDIDRRSHRRQNYDIGLSRESSPARGKPKSYF